VAGAVVLGSLTVLAGGAATAVAASPSLTSRLGPAAVRSVRVRSIAVGGNPHGVAIDPRTGTAWVAADDLVRIREATQKVTARIRIEAGFIAVDPRTGTVWVASPTGTALEVSEATNKVIHRWKIGGLEGLRGVAADPRTGTVWVASDGSAVEINEASHRIIRRVSLGLDLGSELPDGIAVDPRTGTVWVTILPDSPAEVPGWLAEISQSAHRVTHKFLTLSTNSSAAVDSAKGTVWVADGDGPVSVIRESAQRVVRTLASVPAFSVGIAIDSRTRTVLISNRTTGNNVLVLSEISGKVTRTIRVGFFPFVPAVDPATGDVYVPIVFRGVVSEFHL
jgi:DNA-binding beta-propeller fold protein YncE